jgi:LacI family transcriptional regulator
MKPTIISVAKLANVSKATVSRVINNNPQVKEEIKQRVLRAIDELAYHPSAVARNLAKSTTNMIGLILPDITNPFFPGLARGIEDAAHRLGYTLFISNTDNEPKIEHDYIHKMVQQQVAGIILISSILNEEQVNDLISLQTPIVLCDRLISSAPFDTVTIDNYKAAYEAVEYFINKGHTRICHLSGPSFLQSAEKRKQGYSDAMRNAGLEPFICSGSFKYEFGYEKMGDIIDEYKPTAVFAANDLVALGAMNAIEKKGLQVPKDIAVMGFDDVLFAQMSKPLLSTISIPTYQIGVTAVELLDERIKGVRSETKNVIVQHKRIQRESCSGEDPKNEL